MLNLHYLAESKKQQLKLYVFFLEESIEVILYMLSGRSFQVIRGSNTQPQPNVSVLSGVISYRQVARDKNGPKLLGETQKYLQIS